MHQFRLVQKCLCEWGLREPRIGGREFKRNKVSLLFKILRDDVTNSKNRGGEIL